MIKSMLLSVIGQRNAGRLDYILKRKSADAWGPLNGQRIRQGVYAEIMRRIDFQAMVETGTYRGTTTAYFAESGLPVYTVEIDPRCFAYASLRFKNHDRVKVYNANSPDFLRELQRMTGSLSRVFFYLDAHVQDSAVYHKPPLAEELEIIFTHWNHAVVMIDDFQVPGSTYSFDDWGPGKNLSLECLDTSFKKLALSAFFPTLDAGSDTGAKRGWVVVCRADAIAQILKNVPGLSQYGASHSAG